MAVWLPFVVAKASKACLASSVTCCIMCSDVCLLQVDMEGKRADWEGVVLVPFVDEVRAARGAQLLS